MQQPVDASAIAEFKDKGGEQRLRVHQYQNEETPCQVRLRNFTTGMPQKSTPNENFLEFPKLH